MFTEDCGCEHDGTSWTKKCAGCRKEGDETSARWAADRTREIPIKVHRVNGRIVSGEAVEVVPEPVVIKKVVEAKQTSGQLSVTTPKTGTKLEQALAIYKGLLDRTRKNVIATFVRDLNMTPAGASTYQYTCKQKLGE